MAPVMVLDRGFDNLGSALEPIPPVKQLAISNQQECLLPAPHMLLRTYRTLLLRGTLDGHHVRVLCCTRTAPTMHREPMASGSFGSRLSLSAGEQRFSSAKDPWKRAADIAPKEHGYADCSRHLDP